MAVPFYSRDQIAQARELLDCMDFEPSEVAECSSREVVALMDLNYRPEGMAGFVQWCKDRAEWRAASEAQMAREFSTSTESELF